MALATQCPHCNTTFRVASDQLKLRGGIVRCGACNEVFDGNASLIDLDALAARQAGAPAPDTAAEADAAPASPPEPSASAAFDAEVAAIDARVAASTEPIYTLDFDTTFDPFGILPKSALPAQPEPEAAPAPEPEPIAQAEPESEPEPEPESEPEPEPEPVPEPEPEPAFEPEAAPELTSETEFEPGVPPEPETGQPPADEEIVVAPPANVDRELELSNAEDRIPALPLRESAPPEPRDPPEVELTPTAIPVEPVAAAEPEPDEPEFMKRGRRLERAGRTRRIAMGSGSLLLLLALAAQGVIVFRNVLAARYPQTKPALVASCGVLGCRVELPAQIDTLSVETGELQSLGANTFSFTTLLRNQGGLAQAWPHIELALTDANDKPLLRRVFTPAEYLPQGVAVANGFAPRSEQPVKLYFELKQLKASGYHIAVFYP